MRTRSFHVTRAPPQVREASLRFLRTTLPAKRFAAALRIQRTYRAQRARRLQRERRNLSALKSARKGFTRGLGGCFVSLDHEKAMAELERFSHSKRLLEQGRLVDDV